MAGRDEFRAGYVAIVGRPNVGKSTLLNRLVGQKLSITSRKPQTTRQRVTGIVNLPQAQLVFVDTPGFQMKHGGALNRSMNRVVVQSLAQVDIVVLVIEALRFGSADRALFKLLPTDRPVVLVINKIDQVPDRNQLLPFIQDVSQQRVFTEVVPVSATKGHSAAKLAPILGAQLPLSDPIYSKDEITESSERLLAAELIREKLFHLLGDELPYSSAVIIERFTVEGRLRRIHASIIVARESHKGIVVGAKGARLKDIASRARIEMEKLFGGKVYLEVWVKVKEGWTENAAVLKRLGYPA